MSLIAKARRALSDAWAGYGPFRPQEIAPAEIHPWDPNNRLVDLTGEDDWLTLGDLFTGLAVFGATGSGKTSSLATIAVTLMQMECSFVWMCAKPDELQLVKRLAEHAGRLQDIVIIGRDTDGRITDQRFNPLDYEASLPEAGTGNVVRYLSDCNKVLSRKEGSQGGDKDGRFWDTQFERLLRYCIDTAKLAGRHLSVDLLRRIQLSAPLNDAQLADRAWAEKSTCWQCIREAEIRLSNDEIAEEDFDRVLSFWSVDYMQFDAKPRSTIDVMFAALVDSFYAEEPLRSILTKETTITPEDVIDKGKIVVLSLPTSLYHEAGRMAQFCFKYSYQRAMLRRKKPADGSHFCPSVLWMDEGHNFCHPFDAERYFPEVRSNRGISVLLEQSVGGCKQALGAHSMDEVTHYLSNLATRFFFQNGDPLTNLFGADAIGKTLTEQKNKGETINPDNYTRSTGATLIERHQVLSGDFIQLRRGGVANDRQVDFIVAKAGGVFNQTGSNWARHYFTQTELTR